MEEALSLGGKSGGGGWIKLAIRLSRELVPTSPPHPHPRGWKETLRDDRILLDPLPSLRGKGEF